MSSMPDVRLLRGATPLLCATTRSRGVYLDRFVSSTADHTGATITTRLYDGQNSKRTYDSTFDEHCLQHSLGPSASRTVTGVMAHKKADGRTSWRERWWCGER